MKHTIGKRIKEARLAKKMTQSEVVGTFITRNMLSQIESGTALPSMKTLAYLSSVLEVPVSELLAEEPSSQPTKAPALTDQSDYAELAVMKTLMREKDYATLLDLLNIISETDPLYDEKYAYRARASYLLAKQLEADDDLPSAIVCAKNAESYASLGFYANDALKADALLLLARLAERLGKRYQ